MLLLTSVQNYANILEKENKTTYDQPQLNQSNSV